jgi:hypothetical protein
MVVAGSIEELMWGKEGSSESLHMLSRETSLGEIWEEAVK